MAKTLSQQSNEDLLRIYQASSALLRGIDPDEVPQEELNAVASQSKETVQYLINNNMGVFDRDQNQFDPEKGTLTADKKSPKQDFISRAKMPLNEDSFTLHAILMANGYEVTSFGGKITSEDDDNLRDLADRYESGTSTFQNRQSLVAEFKKKTKLAHEAALAAAAAKQTVADAVQGAKEEVAEQQAQLQLNQQSQIETKLEVLGYDDPKELTNKFTARNQEWAQANSEEIFGHKMNIYEIDNLIANDPKAANALLDYAIEQGDYREELVQWQAEGDYDKIRAVVGGETDLETALNAKEYISDAKGLSNSINHLYDGETLTPHAIRRNLDSGAIPIVAEALPKELATLPESIKKTQIANHLSDPANYAAYSQYLETTYSQDFANEHANIFDADIAKFTEVQLKEEAALKTAAEPTSINTIGMSISPAAGDNTGHTTAEGVSFQNSFAQAVQTDRQALQTEQSVLYDRAEALPEDLLDRLTKGLESIHVGTNAPDEITQLQALYDGIKSAENDLTSYQTFPNTLNELQGVKGAVGAPYAPITDQLTNNILAADNEFVRTFLEMSEEQQGLVIAHLEPEDQPTPADSPQQSMGNWLAGVVSNIFGNEAHASPEASEPTPEATPLSPKVSGLDIQ